MARSPCIERSRSQQRGDMLLESLIAVVLVGFIGLGLVYVTARTAASQRTTNAGNLTVGALRSHLQTAGIAEGCPTEGTAKTTLSIAVAAGAQLESVEKTCTVQSSTVRIGAMAKTVKVPHVRFEVTDAALLGSRDALQLGN